MVLNYIPICVEQYGRSSKAKTGKGQSPDGRLTQTLKELRKYIQNENRTENRIVNKQSVVFIDVGQNRL